MVTFYVILTVVAASIVAAQARPARNCEVRQLLLAGDLLPADRAEPPSLECICQESGHLLVIRRGIDAIALDGACSLAIDIKGADINIEERLTVGRGILIPAQTAVFDLGTLAQGYYHVHYNSSKAAVWTAFTLHVRPGLTMTRRLRH